MKIKLTKKIFTGIMLALFSLSANAQIDEAMMDEDTMKIDPLEVRSYTLKKGDLLRARINQWTKLNGYQLVWEVKDDTGRELQFMLPADVNIEANYYNAVIALLRSYRMNGKRNQIKFGHDFHKNKVLRVYLTEQVK
jgi:hypothetical protein